VIRDPQGGVVGTAGMRGLRCNPGLADMFARRYPRIDRVAFNCRLYVAPAWRGQGLGRILIALREQTARQMDYATVYLHCNANAERLRRYWLAQGFRLIHESGEVAHYDKALQ
jgi:GNAT superfamily N-acetyltransferase